MAQKIFLLGFMGVGKTTIGKKLANQLAVEFIDTDQYIEKKEGASVTEIFQNQGEETFRIKEHEALSDLIEKEQKLVISVGGGLPCYFNNMDQMNRSGITIYLERPAKELFQRLKQGKSKRPLIADLSDEELLLFIEKLLKKRTSFYEQSQLIVNRNEQKVDLLIQMINQFPK